MSISNLFNRPKQNFKVIDGIRAIAILWVIIFHSWLFQLNLFLETSQEVVKNKFLIWISRGDLGVDLFFVISGFLIGSILFKEYKKNSKLNFKKFYIRRFFRLIPVYIFAMVIGVYFLKGTVLDTWHLSWANLLYINNYITGSYMPWTWSLAIEEQFYIIIPFLIAFIFPLFKRKTLFFIILAIIPIVLKYHNSVIVHDFKIPFEGVFIDDAHLTWFWDYYVYTHLRYGGLLSGVIAAYLYVFKSDNVINYFNKYVKFNNVLIVISFVLLILISSITLGQWTITENSIFENFPPVVGSWYEILHREIFCYIIAYLILTSLFFKGFAIKPFKSFLSLKIFYPIAQVSYSAYLFHEMFMFWYFPKATSYFKEMAMSESTIIVINGLVSMIVILLVAALMYLIIELPFQRLRNKLTVNT